MQLCHGHVDFLCEGGAVYKDKDKFWLVVKKKLAGGGVKNTQKQNMSSALCA